LKLRREAASLNRNRRLRSRKNTAPLKAAINSISFSRPCRRMLSRNASEEHRAPLVRRRRTALEGELP